MSLPDWSKTALEDGVLRETTADGGRVVLWLPGERDGSFQYWERVGSVPRAEVNVDQGLYSTAAASIPAKQRHKGVMGKLLSRFHEAKGTHTLVLPGGETVEPCGERSTDLLLVWAQDSGQALDEARIKSVWPEARRHRRLGPNLFLVGGLMAENGQTGRAPVQPPPLSDGNPRTLAEGLLSAARQGGDRAKELSALTDLAIITVNEGKTQAAIPQFEEALKLARELGDHVKESDILGNLGMALLYAQQPGRARPLFEQDLAHARSTGDIMAEKLALERLGLVASNMGESQRALSHYDEALNLTRQVGDRHQEANLLWYQGIQLAELGRRDDAIARAQDSINLFSRLGKPQAGWYGAYLQKYRMGQFDTWPAPAATGVTMGPQDYLGGSLVAGVMAGPPAGAATTPRSTTGPSLLRMALSATKAMAQFAGSGFKTTPPEVQRVRLQTCATCEHHTGLRCKICGCFTAAKSKLLQESCPIGKWPG